MEEKIRFRIDLVKNRIASLEKELETQEDILLRAWARGAIASARMELEALEDMLLAWEEYQQFGAALPF
jgi:hypothetical protein